MTTATQPALNRRLSPHDASFLYVDRPNQPMHGAGIGIYEGYLSLQDVIRITEERLHLTPRFRQKVVFPPFGIAHPTWEDDPTFDIRNHIVEETLPAPGDDRVLAKVVGRIMAPQLDFTKPLWKMVVLHGLADGNTAIVSMVHHAMIDGVSGVDLALVTHDLVPDPAPLPPAPEWKPAPLPDPATLYQSAVRDNAIESAKQWMQQVVRQSRPQEAAAQAERLNKLAAALGPNAQQPAPRTPFNGPISRERAGSWVQFSFTEVRAIRSALGGTVNDVVLAVIAGALGKYLRAHRYTTDGVELRTMCPVSMRGADGHGAMGNQVSAIMAPLFVGITDPVALLKAEREAMERRKEADQAGIMHEMAQQPNPLPAWAQALQGQIDASNTMLNTVTSNVPGPQVPLYLSGHKMLRSLGFGMLSANIGMFHGIGSYNQVLTIGVTVDPTQIKDEWFYAECLKESFAELRDAAAQVAGTTAAASATTMTPVFEHGPRRNRRQPATEGAAAR